MTWLLGADSRQHPARLEAAVAYANARSSKPPTVCEPVDRLALPARSEGLSAKPSRFGRASGARHEGVRRQPWVLGDVPKTLPEAKMDDPAKERRLRAAGATLAEAMEER